MSQMPGKIKVLSDLQLRVTATGTTVGAAQGKGTATDLMVTILAGPDGASAVAGSTAATIQGSNVTASASSNWTGVTPDKGTAPTITASGQTVLHFAQLQYPYYRVSLVAATTATANVETVFAFMPTQDSFDASVQ